MPKLIGKLPASAEAILKSAAAVGAPGSLARRAAVDRALDQVQREFADYFVSVPEPETRTGTET